MSPSSSSSSLTEPSFRPWARTEKPPLTTSPWPSSPPRPSSLPSTCRSVAEARLAMLHGGTGGGRWSGGGYVPSLLTDRLCWQKRSFFPPPLTSPRLFRSRWKPPTGPSSTASRSWEVSPSTSGSCLTFTAPESTSSSPRCSPSPVSPAPDAPGGLQKGTFLCLPL